MIKRRFGRTGLQVTPLGFGAAPVAYLDVEKQRAARVVDVLLEHGVNVFDTAASYPGSEEFLGEQLAGRRDDVVLISKCGQSIPESNAAAWTADLVLATVDRALKRLRTDRIDVMLLHSCSLEQLTTLDGIDGLVRAREAGKIRFAGYSGDNEAAAWAADHPEMAVIETSINIADQRNIDTVLPRTTANDLGVIAKRPMANTAWRTSLPGMYQKYAERYAERLAKMRLDPSTLQGGDWAELALRFTLSVPGVHTAVIGTTNPDNVAANLRAAEKPSLPPASMASIRQSFSNAQASEMWSGLT